MISVRLLTLASLPHPDALREISEALPFGKAEAERRAKLSHTAFRESVGAALALSELTARRSYAPPLTLIRNAHGKPKFEDAALPAFNLSHTDGLAAAILSDRDSGEVGIDVQIRKPIRRADAIVSRFFSRESQALWESSDRSDEAFLVLWTQKEAVAKLCGDALLSEAASLARATAQIRTYRLRFDGAQAYLSIAVEHPIEKIEILSDKEIEYEEGFSR